VNETPLGDHSYEFLGLGKANRGQKRDRNWVTTFHDAGMEGARSPFIEHTPHASVAASYRHSNRFQKGMDIEVRKILRMC